MKKLLMALALLPLMAAAETEVVDGIEWKYTIAEGRVTIGNDTFGGDALKNIAIPCSTSGAITIPVTLGGCPVKRIGEEAFFACKQIDVHYDSRKCGGYRIWGI